MDGNKGAGDQQASNYLLPFLELKGKNVKADGNSDENLGNEKMGHQRYNTGKGWNLRKMNPRETIPCRYQDVYSSNL